MPRTMPSCVEPATRIPDWLVGIQDGNIEYEASVVGAAANFITTTRSVSKMDDHPYSIVWSDNKTWL